MRFKLLLIAAFVLSTSRFTLAAEKPTATEVVKKAIDAIGGAEAINKFPGTIEKSKGTLDVKGNDVPYTAEFKFLDPDKYRNTITSANGPIEFSVIYIVNGDKVQTMSDGVANAVSDEQKKELRATVHLQNILKLTPLLKDQAFKVKLLENSVKVNDKDAYVLTIERKEMNDVKLFIDAKTFLAVKIERRGLVTANDLGNHEMYFSDYKKFDGILKPSKTKSLQNGAVNVTEELLEFKRVDKLPKEEFEIPK